MTLGSVEKVRLWTLIGLFLISSLACVHSKNCNNIPQRPSPSPCPTPMPNAYERAGWSDTTPTPTPEVKREPSIQVYKNTGDLQCEAGKGIPLSDMEATLKKNKITVYDSKTQPDGLMHMALCGSPAGKIHLFTIPLSMQKNAENLGFKIWKDHN